MEITDVKAKSLLLTTKQLIANIFLIFYNFGFPL